MPHKCVKCDLFYDDSAPEVMTGCSCGSKVFLFVRKDQESAVRSIKHAETGKYEIDLNWLFRKEQPAAETCISPEEGKYDIDLATMLHK